MAIGIKKIRLKTSILTILFFILSGCVEKKDAPEKKIEKVETLENIEIPEVSSDCANREEIIFDRIVQTGENTLGYVRIRSSNSFNQNNLDNVIGTVSCGVLVHAFLPKGYRAIVDDGMPSTKNPYYIIQVKNKKGGECVGYIAGWTLN